MEHQPAGLTFELREATTISKGREADGAIVVAVQLQARVHDWALWEQVVAKLDGLKVNTTEDLFEQVVGTLNDDVERLTAQLAEAGKKVERAEKEAATRVAEMEFELNKLRRELVGYKQTIEAIDAVAKLPLR